MVIFQKSSAERIKGKPQTKRLAIGLDEEAFDRMFRIEKKKISREEQRYLRQSNEENEGPG